MGIGKILLFYLVSIANKLPSFARHTIIGKNNTIRQFVSLGDPENTEAGQTCPHFELKASLSLKIWENPYLLESVAVKIGKMYKIGIDMLFFQNKKSVSVCYLFLKIGISISKGKILKIGKNRYRLESV